MIGTMAGALMIGAGGAWVYASGYTSAPGHVSAFTTTLTKKLPFESRAGEGGPGWGGGAAHHAMGPFGAAFKTLTADAAKALNLSTTVLQSDLKGGKTLAELAVQQGTTATALEGTLEADAKALVAQAVSKGTITTTQASQIDAHLPAMITAWVNGKFPHMMFRMGPWGGLMKDAATALNLSPTVLRQDLAQGDTLAQLAAKQGSTAAALEATLVKDVESQLAKAVSAGKLTAAQEQKIEANLPAMVDQMVTHPLRPGWGMGGMGRGAFPGLLSDAATFLKMPAATLEQDLAKGESLATVATNAGSSATALETALVSDVKAQIQKAVSSGKLTAAQASAMEAHLSAVIDAFVTHAGGPPQGGHRGWGMRPGGAAGWGAMGSQTAT
jgi:hypothetical protein